MKWYDMPGALTGLECEPAYLEKLAIDADAEPGRQTAPGRKAPRRACSWVRKRRFKKKMVRRFLSINPDLDYSGLCGTDCRPGIWLRIPSYEDDGFYDPRMIYLFNTYTKVFLSPRGDLRKYHGDVFPDGSSYALGRKDKDAAKITNRRIRRHANDAEPVGSYSFCRKLYGPLIDEVW